MQTTLHHFQKNKPASGEPNREQRAKIAADTLEAVKAGSYAVGNQPYTLAAPVQAMITGTVFESPASAPMANWKHPPTGSSASLKTSLEVRQASTLEALRALTLVSGARVGVLNFASAHKPGGGFLSGAQAQEESLARSSTIYSSLMSATGQLFYHDKKEPGWYSHAMLWTPGVTFFRDDLGHWLPPCSADLVTSAAVNAGAVKSKLPESEHPEAAARVHSAMQERMGRILALFERNGSTHLVLGSYGTGVFKNDVKTVATIWASLVGPGGRFEHSFLHIDFAIIDEKTCTVFRDAFVHQCGEMWSGLRS